MRGAAHLILQREGGTMFTEIGGIKINYDVRGQGEPVLLLHGWGANIKLFDNLMSLLAAKYQVLRSICPALGKVWSRLPPGA